MFRLSLRQIFPKGLYARSAMLSVLPVLIVLALLTTYYFTGYLRTVNSKLSQGVARQVSVIQESCKTDAENKSTHASIERRLSIQYDCDYKGQATGEETPARFFYADLVRARFREILGTQTDIFLAPDSRQLDIRVVSDRSTLRVLVDRKRVVDINGHVFIVWVSLIGLLMALTALAFLRNHVRSILRLTEATQAFGRGREVEGFRPSGAREVRAAANAVLEMRANLIGFAEQRTMMLAGVSHDLRTPLTRLQLQLAMQEQTEDVLEARGDIRDMEAMLEEYLAFARGEDGEQVSEVDLSVILGGLIAKLSKVRLIKDDVKGCLIRARPIALKRAISNLLQNATAYGDLVEVRLEKAKGAVLVIVDDNGPGIPKANYEDAFRPFTRLNEARTQNTPGVGLGLALARDTAIRHGGRVILGRSPLGGLRVQMTLPA